MNRRHFLTATACALGAPALLRFANAAETRAPLPIKLGISTYSYWHFKTEKVPIENVIDSAAALGVGGVDILHRQMELDEQGPLTPAVHRYCQRLKRHAFRAGIDLICLSIHQDFVSPTPAERQKAIAHTEKCIELAYALGVPCIRLNSGRWKTIPDFDALMKARGEEPVLPGYQEADAFKWCIESIRQCTEIAATRGVLLALENHWGPSRTPEGVLRIVSEVNSPWLGALIDTGNFLEEPYDKIAQMAPKAVFVQAKSYEGGGEFYTLNLDNGRIAKILRDAGYSGYVSLEMEGKEDPKTAVPKAIANLRAAFK